MIMDDRALRPGERMMEALMVGYPFIVVIGKQYPLLELQTRVVDHRPVPLAKNDPQPMGAHKQMMTEAQLLEHLSKHASM